MKKSMYTRTALVSLLTLCSFSSFAADFPYESMKEIKKQESTKTSGKTEVMKTSNKKLKEKMDRICNADPRKKAEELKKKEEIRLANEKKAKLIEDSKAKALNAKNSNIEKGKVSKTKRSKTKNAKVEAKDVKKDIKVVNKNTEEKGKASPVASVGRVDIIDTNQGQSNLRITFGGVVDAQGYGKAGPSGANYKRYNVMPNRSTEYYNATPDITKGANPIFYEGIGNIGDYSNDMGMIADAILHLRAENKNEDLGLLYGADVQFHVPVTEGKGASQGVYAAKGRSAHVFVNSKYGDVKLGYQFGPEALMRLDATRIATVDGAADSDWFRKVNLEGSAASFPFYVTPRLYTESFSSESEKFSFRMAGKYNKGVMTTLPFRVAYYSPNYMGARFGISYSPRYDSGLFTVKETVSEDKGGKIEHKETIKHVGPDYEHIVSAGASYEYDFDKHNIKVKTSAVGEYGFPKQPSKDKHLYKEFVEYNDLMGVNFGVSADYKINEDQGVKFAASFAYLGKSGQPKGIKKLIGDTYTEIDSKDATDGKRVEGLKAQFGKDSIDTMYWTVGAGYQHENIYTSLTYFGSRMNDKDMLHDGALGVQYDLSPACSKNKFVPYAALHYFMTNETGKLKDESDADVPSNQGILLLTGVKFSF
ncbi:WD0745 family porin [Wolbachia endosymbiont of Drosophila pseudotakahashii]|uniref:WD0745 family porin n=1 Tax=Wolbachia endosymbiont of Drosophila pseudotakahashii TaxID=375919 RepID=UPI00222F5C32|nr:porin [Wolbachia endosymbiont of Drosophila pseudotakahashii]MCX3065334.1 porin [Wolbachia endosymbiont of Drosophila pseudotakahashii]UZE38972.1 porin [Wolbachia endosymbiont of Drosophila pseudotakahashii]